MQLDYAVVIPARYGSTRFPGKPLVDLCGVPMIVRTYRRCVEACPVDRVFVATDDERVSEVCDSFGIQVVETSSNCLTGTDRVAEVAEILGIDTVVNVQGDEPVFEPKDIRTLLDAAIRYPGEVLSGYCSLSDERQFWDWGVPKVVLRPDSRLLYMTRGSVPIGKDGVFVTAWRQVCAYVFPRAALSSFVSVKAKTPLEEIEDIEILRFLELGWEVRMIELSDRSHPVDASSDLEQVERLIRERGL